MQLYTTYEKKNALVQLISLIWALPQERIWNASFIRGEYKAGTDNWYCSAGQGEGMGNHAIPGRLRLTTIVFLYGRQT